jgi:two-component system NtrC family sensor kinase
MTSNHAEAVWKRWGTWGPALLAVAVVAALFCLAAANVVVRVNWSEVEDGILWMPRPEGLVANAVAAGSPGERAGVEPGDVLLAVDGRPVESAEDLLAVLHASRDETRLSYTVLSLGTRVLRELTLQPVPTAGLLVYIVLAGVGFFAILIGASVRVRKPDHQATLHFFWLTVAFFGVFAFSFSGRFDRLDWVFFWADEVSILLLAPLFMHFALVFPERSPGWLRHKLGNRVFPLIYVPAIILGVAQAITIVGVAGGPRFPSAVELIWRLEEVYLAGCTIGGLAIMIVALKRVPSVTAQRQLRWVVSGAVFGGMPYSVGYALPWALGFEPVAGFHLFAVSLGLIPLAFAAAIERYRLWDVEVIIKRGLVYTAAVAAMAAIYLILEQLASEVFLEESDEHNSIIALLATAVVVLLAEPVKNRIQAMLDQLYYRDRYDYRRALVGFARDLNTDLDLNRLTERLVTRVTETLLVDRMILLLDPRHSEDVNGEFRPLRWVGFDSNPPGLPRRSGVADRLHGRPIVGLSDPAVRRRVPEDELAFWQTQGIYYFVPCVSEEGIIAVMALGRKGSGQHLSSEDMALLAAVAGQVATALENGRLYDQLQVKAAELDRLRQFSENIIESLNDGLVVLDLDDKVVRWNAGLERIFGVQRDSAVGQRLETLFDPKFVDRLRGARHEEPSGAVLYRIPLLSRHDEKHQRLLVNAATAPLLTPDGDTNGTMVIIEDITRRVQLEEQLQLSEKMASIGLLAAGVAHEVNTPLTGISSFTQILLEGADPEDPKTRLLEKIERQTFRAAKIVNGLLNLSRPARSDAAGPVDVNVVINDVLALLEHQLQAGNVKVRRELSEGAPLVQGVEFKVQQVFLNLCLNARDAMSKGGWLSICSRVAGDTVVVDVADTGAGISDEHLSRIYDPFFTTKLVGHGTGLGLSVTYSVIQEHRGSIKCTSELGHGTRFTITLPLAISLTAEQSTSVAQ